MAETQSSAVASAQHLAFQLLELEQRSRRQGSGVGAAELVGDWELRDLWTREARPQPRQAALLRLVAAQLAIVQEPAGLVLRNSVSLGRLSLCFVGTGHLQGRRPLLRFSFQQLELQLGERLLWQRPLPEMPAQRQPFFALIGCGRDDQGRWLLARGRGGGLARWRCR